MKAHYKYINHSLHSDMMTIIQRLAFNRKYGKVMMLLAVEVQAGAIS